MNAKDDVDAADDAAVEADGFASEVDAPLSAVNDSTHFSALVSKTYIPGLSQLSCVPT